MQSYIAKPKKYNINRAHSVNTAPGNFTYYFLGAAAGGTALYCAGLLTLGRKAPDAYCIPTLAGAKLDLDVD
jgi:hypothetical protein